MLEACSRSKPASLEYVPVAPRFRCNKLMAFDGANTRIILSADFAIRYFIC
jgi:hypothetical protein